MDPDQQLPARRLDSADSKYGRRCGCGRGCYRRMCGDANQKSASPDCCVHADEASDAFLSAAIANGRCIASIDAPGTNNNRSGVIDAAFLPADRAGRSKRRGQRVALHRARPAGEAARPHVRCAESRCRQRADGQHQAIENQEPDEQSSERQITQSVGKHQDFGDR